MQFIYIVIENGDPYLEAYSTYNDAVIAVKLKHKEILEEDEDEGGFDSVHVVDTPELNVGPTILYIEKGIHIEIHKFKIFPKM
jgi:hypothetical protein